MNRSEEEEKKNTNNDILVTSVFDGHGGAKAMLFLKKHFLSAFEAIAEEIFEDSRSSLDTVDVIKRATSLAFAEADVAFEKEALECVLKGEWGAAQVGACVLMACTTDSSIVVANAGDCRALLAVRDETNNKLRPCQISNDHNAREKVEKIKLRNAHPDESNVIVEYVVLRSQS
jgi:pyruvate dehydrogenase phosphatase